MNICNWIFYEILQPYEIIREIWQSCVICVVVFIATLLFTRYIFCRILRRGINKSARSMGVYYHKV
ncbi:P6 protein [Rose virus R]|uniref:P6 protein n=1 Tax=Rose virus R TaxID=2805917 RepID=A0AAE7PG23_9RHAB|nr:P6 protein [Rose virus R]QQZ02078.1 P6 protein [Rose virus R]